MNKMLSKNKKNFKEKQIEKMEKSKFGMYRGPIDLGQSKTTGEVELLNLTDVVTSLSSTGLGVIALERTFNPNVTTEWTSFAARFREYRVLAVQVKYMPFNIVNTTVFTPGPCVIATNKGPAFGTPTSNAQVWALAKPKLFHLAKPMKYIIRADDYTDLDVGATASPSSEFSIVLYADGLSTSVLYGRFFCTWVVQFSSRS